MIVWNQAALKRSGLDADTVELSFAKARRPALLTVVLASPRESEQEAIERYLRLHESTRRVF